MHMEYITEKKRFGTIGSYYFRLLQSTSGKRMGSFCADSWFCTKNAIVHVSVCVCEICSSTLLLHPALCVCVCVCVCVCLDVCVLCPSLGIQSRSIFVPHISHQYFTPSPPLFSSLSLAPSLFSWASE